MSFIGRVATRIINEVKGVNRVRPAARSTAS
jgi:GMP synthase PP-ATPase subunit